MKKSLPVGSHLFPMPVYMIATYSDDGKVDVMNMAWGGICAENMVVLNLDEDHMTSKNIKKRMAFTLSVADSSHVKESDFFGLASANKIADKFERSAMHAVKSEHVDAPVIEEYPLTLECKVVELRHSKEGFSVLGEIVNVLVEESALDENGKVDVKKLDAIVFDTFKFGYYSIGEKVGSAFKSGAQLLKG